MLRIGKIGKLTSKQNKKGSTPPPPETYYIKTSDGKYLLTSDGEKITYKH